LEIKRQFEIRRANIQNIIKENDELVKNSKVKAAASTIIKVSGLQLSVSIYEIFYIYMFIVILNILRRM